MYEIKQGVNVYEIQLCKIICISSHSKKSKQFWSNCLRLVGQKGIDRTASKDIRLL